MSGPPATAIFVDSVELRAQIESAFGGFTQSSSPAAPLNFSDSDVMAARRAAGPSLSHYMGEPATLSHSAALVPDSTSPGSGSTGLPIGIVVLLRRGMSVYSDTEVEANLEVRGFQWDCVPALTTAGMVGL